MLQDHDTNVLRADLGSANAEFFFNLSGQMIQLGHIEAEVLCGRAQTSQDLETIEGLAGPVSLHNNKGDLFNAFERRESPIAGEAFPSTTDGRPVIRGTGIDHLVVDT